MAISGSHFFHHLRIAVRAAVLTPLLPKNFNNQPLASGSAE
ncbi:hypothetical protein EC2788150_5122, partial [Escherichia coli 2788150]